MKAAFAICLAVLWIPARAQYYLRGEVRDENNAPLPNTRLLIKSTGYVYYSGSSGGFGIPSKEPTDSATVMLDGYQTQTVLLQSDKYQKIVLKVLFASTVVRKDKLLSFTKDLTFDDRNNWTIGGETYSSLLENPFVSARKYPETGFAIHTDKAAYSNIRRLINMDMQVPPDAVRTEEMLNYFDLGTARPPKDSVFGFDAYLSDCPWESNDELFYLNLAARKIDEEKVPPSNLVFLIDISGSMDMPNRLPLLKSAFKLLVGNLREKDTISIVVYGSTVGVWLPPTSGKEKDKIRKAIEDLYPGGSTPGESGIRIAYQLAKNQFIPNGNNRVILATDGDFNVGQTSDDELDKLITRHQQWGIYLTCLGVGMGNYKDSKLEVLAKKGNGNFAYLDNEHEAEKVLVKEFTQTLYTVADDVFVNVHFNPDLVRQYRLIGFDNKAKAVADTTSEMEGGEVGSGHSAVAIFEISPAYGSRNDLSAQNTKLADISVNYKHPGDSVWRVSQFSCNGTFTEFNDLAPGYRFGTAVAMFASLLRNSKFTRRIGWNDAIIMANKSKQPGNFIQEEFVQIVEKAKKLYRHSRRKEVSGSPVSS